MRVSDIKELQEKAGVSETTAWLVLIEDVLQRQLDECYDRDYKFYTVWDAVADAERRREERQKFDEWVAFVKEMGLTVNVRRGCVTVEIKEEKHNV